VVAACVCPLRAQDDGPLARLVPADVGLFAEVRGADDLLVPLTEEQVWITLAELAGQPARPEDAREWRRRIEDTVGFKPKTAIEVLFSKQVAFVGEGPGRSQDAVVLCRPTDAIPIDGLLRMWKAEPWPQIDAPNVYRLRNNIGLAVRGRTLIFGDALRREGMFHGIVRFNTARSGAGLADDPTYQRLLARVPTNPDGILFARMGQAGTLPELPGPLRGAVNVLFAMHRRDSLLHFTAVGDAPLETKQHTAKLTPLIETLPARTLIAWASHIDFPDLMRAVERLPDRNALRIAVKLPEQPELVEELFAALSTQTCFAAGWVTPERRPSAAPPVPAVAMIVSAKEPRLAADHFAQLVQSWVTVYDFLLLTQGLPSLPARKQIQLGQIPAWVQDLSNLIEGIDGGAIGELELCWALDQDVLIIASHSDWLRQILQARRGDAETLATVLQLPQHPVSTHSETIIVSQSGPISDLGARWLRFLAGTVPEVLEDAWWRDKQPGGRDARIGIVTEDTEKRGLRVTAVRKGMPAYGVLEVGDVIVGCGRGRFTTTQPVQEVRQALGASTGMLELLVERDGLVRPCRIPLPFVNPVQILKRIVAIGKIAQRVVYYDDVPDQAGPRGFLTIELRKDPRPLFNLDTRPTTRPALRPTDMRPKGSASQPSPAEGG
jgi:hypothetical protein